MGGRSEIRISIWCFALCFCFHQARIVHGRPRPKWSIATTHGASILLKSAPMNRKSLVALVVALIALEGAWVVYTQNAKPPGPLRIEKLKPDLYMISGEG